MRAWLAVQCCHLLALSGNASCSWALLIVPPHCNRFQMVLDMMETLNTRGKRSALVRGGGGSGGQKTGLIQNRLLFSSLERELYRELIQGTSGHRIISGYPHILMTECIVHLDANNASKLQWMRVSLLSFLKSVPTQEHRFQMVLDGILYSKTPSETSSLGRMPLDKTLFGSHVLLRKKNKTLLSKWINMLHAFYQLTDSNTINKMWVISSEGKFDLCEGI